MEAVAQVTGEDWWLQEVKAVSVDKTRGFLYKLARAMGDWQAVSSGDAKRMARRAGRRATG